MEAQSTWFLITAGHCIEHLRQIHRATNLTVIDCALYDGWAPARLDSLIPFNFEDAQSFALDDDAVGFDIGVIPLEPIHRRLLEKGGVVAFPASTWSAPAAPFIGYVLIGQPSELLEPAREGLELVNLRVNPVVIPIQHASQQEKDSPKFIGKFPDTLLFRDGSTMNDIAGMSGGPILGFVQRANGDLSYYAVAIQSSWNKERRTITATKVDSVGRSLLAAIQRSTFA